MQWMDPLLWLVTVGCDMRNIAHTTLQHILLSTARRWSVFCG
jgi:hypothetical protein